MSRERISRGCCGCACAADGTLERVHQASAANTDTAGAVDWAVNVDSFPLAPGAALGSGRMSLSRQVSLLRLMITSAVAVMVVMVRGPGGDALEGLEVLGHGVCSLGRRAQTGV